MRNHDFVMQNKIFIWIAAATGIILMVPLIMMQISNDWDWSLSDFIITGTLLFGMGSLFVYMGVMPRKYRVLIGLAVAIATLYIWAELAVGIFTNLGS